jgi:hypothetical protein
MRPMDLPQMPIWVPADGNVACMDFLSSSGLWRPANDLGGGSRIAEGVVLSAVHGSVLCKLLGSL